MKKFLFTALSLTLLVGCEERKENAPPQKPQEKESPDLNKLVDDAKKSFDSASKYVQEAAHSVKDAAQNFKDRLSEATQNKQVTQAIAEIHPTKVTEGTANRVEGKVVFKKVDGGILVVAKLTGLKPGVHGFHIHEKGDCSAPDASSAGGHFNPYKKPHAAPDQQERHVGDLGNIIANENGEASYESLNSLLTFDGEASILGRAVIVHTDPDDFKSQPTGNAGGRIGCGVIKALE